MGLTMVWAFVAAFISALTSPFLPSISPKAWRLSSMLMACALTTAGATIHAVDAWDTLSDFVGSKAPASFSVLPYAIMLLIPSVAGYYIGRSLRKLRSSLYLSSFVLHPGLDEGNGRKAEGLPGSYPADIDGTEDAGYPPDDRICPIPMVRGHMDGVASPSGGASDKALEVIQTKGFSTQAPTPSQTPTPDIQASHTAQLPSIVAPPRAYTNCQAESGGFWKSLKKFTIYTVNGLKGCGIGSTAMLPDATHNQTTVEAHAPDTEPYDKPSQEVIELKAELTSKDAELVGCKGELASTNAELEGYKSKVEGLGSDKHNISTQLETAETAVRRHIDEVAQLQDIVAPIFLDAFPDHQKPHPDETAFGYIIRGLLNRHNAHKSTKSELETVKDARGQKRYADEKARHKETQSKLERSEALHQSKNRLIRKAHSYGRVVRGQLAKEKKDHKRTKRNSRMARVKASKVPRLEKRLQQSETSVKLLQDGILEVEGKLAEEKKNHAATNDILAKANEKAAKTVQTSTKAKKRVRGVWNELRSARMDFGHMSDLRDAEAKNASNLEQKLAAAMKTIRQLEQLPKSNKEGAGSSATELVVLSSPSIHEARLSGEKVSSHDPGSCAGSPIVIEDEESSVEGFKTSNDDDDLPSNISSETAPSATSDDGVVSATELDTNRNSPSAGGSLTTLESTVQSHTTIKKDTPPAPRSGTDETASDGRGPSLEDGLLTTSTDKEEDSSTNRPWSEPLIVVPNANHEQPRKVSIEDCKEDDVEEGNGAKNEGPQSRRSIDHTTIIEDVVPQAEHIGCDDGKQSDGDSEFDVVTFEGRKVPGPISDETKVSEHSQQASQGSANRDGETQEPKAPVPISEEAVDPDDMVIDDYDRFPEPLDNITVGDVTTNNNPVDNNTIDNNTMETDPEDKDNVFSSIDGTFFDNHDCFGDPLDSTASKKAESDLTPFTIPPPAGPTSSILLQPVTDEMDIDKEAAATTAKDHAENQKTEGLGGQGTSTSNGEVSSTNITGTSDDQDMKDVHGGVTDANNNQSAEDQDMGGVDEDTNILKGFDQMDINDETAAQNPQVGLNPQSSIIPWPSFTSSQPSAIMQSNGNDIDMASMFPVPKAAFCSGATKEAAPGVPGFQVPNATFNFGISAATPQPTNLDEALQDYNNAGNSGFYDVPYSNPWTLDDGQTLPISNFGSALNQQKSAVHTRLPTFNFDPKLLETATHAPAYIRRVKPKKCVRAGAVPENFIVPFAAAPQAFPHIYNDPNLNSLRPEDTPKEIQEREELAAEMEAELDQAAANGKVAETENLFAQADAAIQENAASEKAARPEMDCDMNTGHEKSEHLDPDRGVDPDTEAGMFHAQSLSSRPAAGKRNPGIKPSLNAETPLGRANLASPAAPVGIKPDTPIDNLARGDKRTRVIEEDTSESEPEPEAEENHKKHKAEVSNNDQFPIPQLRGPVRYEELINSIPESYGFGILEQHKAINLAKRYAIEAKPRGDGKHFWRAVEETRNTEENFAAKQQTPAGPALENAQRAAMLRTYRPEWRRQYYIFLGNVIPMTREFNAVEMQTVISHARAMAVIRKGFEEPIKENDFMMAVAKFRRDKRVAADAAKAKAQL